MLRFLGVGNWRPEKVKDESPMTLSSLNENTLIPVLSCPVLSYPLLIPSHPKCNLPALCFIQLVLVICWLNHESWLSSHALKIAGECMSTGCVWVYRGDGSESGTYGTCS